MSGMGYFRVMPWLYKIKILLMTLLRLVISQLWHSRVMTDYTAVFMTWLSWLYHLRHGSCWGYGTAMTCYSLYASYVMVVKGNVLHMASVFLVISQLWHCHMLHKVMSCISHGYAWVDHIYDVVYAMSRCISFIVMSQFYGLWQGYDMLDVMSGLWHGSWRLYDNSASVF